MEAIAQCMGGLEPITQLEIKEILKTKSEILVPSRVKFKVKDEKQLTDIIYNTRSSIKVYQFITNFTFATLDEILNEIKKVKFPKIKSPFAVKCERTGEHNFSSIDIEKEVGDIINKNGKLKVDLKEPTTIVIVDIVNNNCMIGIDYTGIKLTRRSYRIKLLSNSLNSCLAYSLIRIAEIKEKNSILDPFCKSGEILIEAALYLQNISPNKKLLDKMAFAKLITYKPKEKIRNKDLNLYAVDSLQNNLRSTEINAKIAGINKNIKCSRIDIEWLDTKFDKLSIDKIITFPPFPTNTLRKEVVEKIYKELFYQAEFVLKNKGTITILTLYPELIEKYSQMYKFKKEKEIKISYIHQQFTILILKK